MFGVGAVERLISRSRETRNANQNYFNEIRKVNEITKLVIPVLLKTTMMMIVVIGRKSDIHSRYPASGLRPPVSLLDAPAFDCANF